MDELWNLLDQMTPGQVVELKDTLAVSDNPEITDVLASVARQHKTKPNGVPIALKTVDCTRRLVTARFVDGHWPKGVIG